MEFKGDNLLQKKERKVPIWLGLPSISTESDIRGFANSTFSSNADLQRCCRCRLKCLCERHAYVHAEPSWMLILTPPITSPWQTCEWQHDTYLTLWSSVLNCKSPLSSSLLDCHPEGGKKKLHASLSHTSPIKESRCQCFPLMQTSLLLYSPCILVWCLNVCRSWSW